MVLSRKRLWRLVAREVVVLADIFGMLGACLPRGVFFPRGADASFALLCLSTSMTRWTNSSSAILNPMFSAMIYPDYHLLAAVYSLHHDQGRCKLPFTVFTGLVRQSTSFMHDTELNSRAAYFSLIIQDAISGMTTSCKFSSANHIPGKKVRVLAFRKIHCL